MRAAKVETPFKIHLSKDAAQRFGHTLVDNMLPTLASVLVKDLGFQVDSKHGLQVNNLENFLNDVMTQQTEIFGEDKLNFVELFGDYRLAYLFLFIGMEDIIWSSFSQDINQRDAALLLLEEVSKAYGVVRDQTTVNQMKASIKATINTSVPMMEYLEVMPDFRDMGHYTIDHLESLKAKALEHLDLVALLSSSNIVLESYLRKQLPPNGVITESMGPMAQALSYGDQSRVIRRLQADPDLRLGVVALLFAEQTQQDVDDAVMASWSGEVMRLLSE